MQEAVLAGLIAETHDSAVVACGDFNRDIDDFTQGTEPGTVVLKYTLHGKPAEITAGSPWFTDDKTYVEPGSYYFEGRWERIDHFFTAGTAAVSCFLPAADGPWAESSGIPRRYEVFTGTGWSDHLPVTATVTY
jgi:endonuclease/exonuclease/phosphatase family metal-dependent hydrolase